jgi:aspartyl-tRNA synthetase
MDLRRTEMQNSLRFRSKITNSIRNYLDENGFLDIETPIMTRATPEGARDYLIPSRTHPGQFFAMPQSPQLFKQLLMVAGFDRYYQIAKCFRDEDLRADRQPEFTQLDLEMSFVTQEDVLSLTEGLFSGLLESLFPEKKFMKPFPRLSYEQSMRDYGTDKPDLRFEMKMSDLGNIAKKTEFNVFHNVVDNQGIVKGFAAPGCGEFTRGQIDELTEFVKERGASGLIAIGVNGAGESLESVDMDKVRSNITRFLTPENVKDFVISTGSPATMSTRSPSAAPVEIAKSFTFSGVKNRVIFDLTLSISTDSNDSPAPLTPMAINPLAPRSLTNSVNSSICPLVNSPQPGAANPLTIPWLSTTL